MTVQQLIDTLNEFEDKDKKVYIGYLDSTVAIEIMDIFPYDPNDYLDAPYYNNNKEIETDTIIIQTVQ